MARATGVGIAGRGGGRAVLLGLSLAAAAPAAADVTMAPATLTLAPGEESSPIQVLVAGAVPGPSSATLVVSGLPPGASARPDPVVVPLSRTGAGAASFRIAASASTPPGEYVVTLSGSAALRVGSATVRLSVLVPGVRVAPALVSLTAGAASPPLTLELTNVGGGERVFALQAPPGLAGRIAIEPDPVRVPVDGATRRGSAAFRIVTARGTPAGTHTLTLRESGSPLAAILTLVVRPALEIRSVVPASIAAESLEVPLRLAGEGFEDGARLAAGDGGIVFGPVRVLSERLAETTASVRADAAPGPHEIVLVNPGGAAAATRIVVVPADALGAPLAIRTVAVVHPAPGSLLGAEEALRPRGVLAVSGTGIVVGTWQLDGVPFERFSLPARGGLPVAVEASMPIPRTSIGEHRLELVVESPQRVASEAVPLALAARRASRLALLFPRDGAVLARPPFALRWSAVPGVESYEVELGGGPPPRIAVALEPRLEPPAGLLAPGVHRWRVRPVFPGGVRGEFSEPRRIAVLPHSVDLRLLPGPGRPGASLRWEGGSAGVLYRVDLLGGADGRVIASALTPRPGFVTPPAWLARAGPLRARVSALAPGGDVLGRSPAVDLPAGAAATLLAAASPPVRVLRRRPEPGSTVKGAHPSIAAQWDTAVVESATLVVDDVDVTAVAHATARGIEYDSLLPLEPGEHTVSLVVGTTLERWTFRVVPGEAGTETAKEGRPPDWRAEPAAPSRFGDWRLAADGTLTYVTGDGGGDDWVGRASLSGQLDLDRPGGFARAAGDLSASTGSEVPGAGSSSLENRSWTAAGGLRQGRVREELSAGYAPPAFLGGSELLSAGLARGGAQAALAGPVGELAYYETFDSDFAGVATGSYAPAQRLRAAGLTLGKASGRLSLRLLGLETEEEAGGLSSGGEGRVYGLVATYRPHPAWTLLVEGARGEFRPSGAGLEAEREGYALRMGLSGSAGGWGVRLNLRDTDAGFVNPANRGLTPGGVSDRTGASLEITRALGRSFLRLAGSHLEGGGGLGLAAAEGRQDGGEAQLVLALGRRVQASLAGSLTDTSSAGDPSIGLPGSEQTDRTLFLQLTETLGTFSLGQSASYQSTEDDLDPFRRNEVRSGGLTLAGPIAGGLSLFAQATAMRVEGDPSFGRTDSLLVAVQPSLVVGRAGLSLLPYFAYSRMENELLATESETTSYQVTLLWTPRLLRSLVSLQASADWTRTVPGPVDAFVARYRFGVTLRRDGGSARPPAPPPLAPAPVPGTRPGGALPTLS